MYTNKNTFFALVLLSIVFAGPIVAMEQSDNGLEGAPKVSIPVPAPEPLVADAVSSTSDDSSDEGSAAVSASSEGWLARFRSYIPSPSRYMPNPRNWANNVRNFEYKKTASDAVAKVKSGISEYAMNFRNNTSTKLKTAGAIAVAAGGAYAGYKGYEYYKNKKAAQQAEQLENAAKEVVMTESEAKFAEALEDADKAWRTALNELFLTLNEAQYAKCPAIFEVMEIGGLDNPTFFRDRKEVLDILTPEQKDGLDQVIKQFEFAAEMALSAINAK